MSKDNEIKIDQVRAIAEKISRDRGITIEEVTVREVRVVLGKGNDGYIGAHLQTVKLEYARSKHLDEKQISHHFNAAVYDEIKRHADNAREVTLAEAEVTKQMFDEICDGNNALEERLGDKEEELFNLQRDHADEVRDLMTDLNSAQTEKSALEVRLKDTLGRVEKTERELSDVRVDLTTASVDLGHVTKERDKLQSTSDEQKDRLVELRNELNLSREAVTKAEQRAELLNWKNDEISRDRDETREKFDVMTERAITAEAQLKANGTPSSIKMTKAAGKSAATVSKR